MSLLQVHKVLTTNSQCCEDLQAQKHILGTVSWSLTMSQDHDHVRIKYPTCRASSNAFVSGKPEHGQVRVRALADCSSHHLILLFVLALLRSVSNDGFSDGSVSQTIWRVRLANPTHPRIFQHVWPNKGMLFHKAQRAQEQHKPRACELADVREPMSYSLSPKITRPKRSFVLLPQLRLFSCTSKSTQLQSIQIPRVFLSNKCPVFFFFFCSPWQCNKQDLVKIQQEWNKYLASANLCKNPKPQIVADLNKPQSVHMNTNILNEQYIKLLKKYLNMVASKLIF